MAGVIQHGPISWVAPSGTGFLPGQAHVWAQQLTGPENVLAVSAHPSRDRTHQALAVERLSTAYGGVGSGPVAVNFVVRNVSDTAVFSYRVFISGITF